MPLIQFIAVGLVAGWILGKIRRGRGYGLLGNLIVGALGSLVGGFLAGLLNIPAGGWGVSIAMAVIGAITFFVVWDVLRSIVRRRRKHGRDEDDE